MDHRKQKILDQIKSNLETANETFKSVQQNGMNLVNEIITPDIEKELSEDQKKMIDDARSAFDLSGGDISKKMEKLTQNIKDYAVNIHR